MEAMKKKVFENHQGSFYAHSPLEAPQSRDPRLQIRLVRVGSADFTLPKEVYLYLSVFARRKEGKKRAHPRARAQLLYRQVDSRLVYTRAAKRLDDLSLPKEG